MLNINRKLSKKGFSLIELMVAVVILAIAILGIFLAFSNAWMGMANARDRTVATNYAREAMENVKNMDFELVTDGLLGVAESVGAKFTREIFVNTENDNLKKIETKVSWTNRQDQDVSVEASMYINRTIFNPGEATRIILYADPYYTVLPDPVKGKAKIIAVIKDINNTTVIDWTGGTIRFSITSDDLPDAGSGSLPDDAINPGVTPTNGIAQTTFTGSAVGDVVIEASVDLPNDGGTVSATITITVTLEVVRIALSAPYSIDAGGSSFTVTAELVDPGDDIVEEAMNPITFVISGNGTFVNPAGGEDVTEITITPPSVPGGTATIDVRPSDTPGVATVTARSDGLLSGTVDIIITGEATSISVSVEPKIIYTDDDGATVTIEIKDENGNPVEFTGEISLTASDGTVPSSLNFAGTSLAETTFSPATASPGTVTITASGRGLTAGNATIEVRDALVADMITIKAEPKNILAGGTDVSKITATIKQGSTVISNYSNDITFKIISDTSSSNDANLLYNGFEYGIDALPPLTVLGGDVDHGVAVVYLNPASYVGKCTVEVSTVNSEFITINKTIEVGFYSGEHHIELKAVPPKMLVNGDTCEVTATVKDENGTTVEAYNEDITFTILVGWPKIAKFAAIGTSSLTKTLTAGETTVFLISQSTAGTVTLKASSFTDITDITGYLNIPVNVTLINLVEESPAYISTDTENILTFNIDVQGAEIILEQMKVSWSENIALEILNKIDIGGTVVYSNGDGVVSGNVVDTVATLPTGIYTINLYFNVGEDMSGKTFNIIFNTNSGNYPVEIILPTIE